MEKLSPETQKALENFKAKWIGQQVKIIGMNHPWKGEVGTVTAIEHTNIGYGLVVGFANGCSGMVFKGTDIKVI